MSDQLTEVYASIDALVDYALDHLDLDPRNADWTRNQIFALFHLDSYPGPKTTTSAASVSDAVQDIVGSRSQAPYGEKTPDPLLAAFRAAATTAGLFDPEEGPAYADTIMGILSANPADLDDRFLLIEHRDGGMAAMQWFYDYCVANNYVKRAQLDRNPRFDSHGLTVTINLAKPEFKNMKKAAAGNAVSGGYPKCTICHENEGFAGRDKRTLRTLPVTLGGESWFWQFSPYGYFDQHGICVNADHTPMHVDRDTFGHLLDFVDRFPGILPRMQRRAASHRRLGARPRPLPGRRRTAADAQGRHLGRLHARRLSGRRGRNPRLARYRRACGVEKPPEHHRRIRHHPRGMGRL